MTSVTALFCVVFSACIYDKSIMIKVIDTCLFIHISGLLIIVTFKVKVVSQHLTIRVRYFRNLVKGHIGRSRARCNYAHGKRTIQSLRIFYASPVIVEQT